MGQRYASAKERRAEIQRKVESDRYVTVLQLVEALGVSANTVRRDLQKLADNDQLRVVHGGAAAFTGSAGLPFPTRAVHAHAEKTRIARAALSYIEAGSTVALDSGTTTLEIAGMLPLGANLTVVTNSLPALAALSQREDLKVIGVGGQYSTETQSFGGPDAWHTIEHLGIRTFFLAASAIGPNGVFAATPYEAATKRLLIKAAEQIVLVCDSSKLLASAPIRVCGWDEISRLVIEREVPELSSVVPDLAVRAAGDTTDNDPEASGQYAPLDRMQA